MSGLNFSLNKRPGGPIRGPVAKKPVTVGDLFGADDGAPKQPATAEPASALSPEVINVAEKLADFVAKNGRGVEDITRQRNPGDTPFKFLFDKQSAGYRFYEAKLREFQAGASGAGTAVRPPAAAPLPSSAGTAVAAPPAGGYPLPPPGARSYSGIAAPPPAYPAAHVAAAAAAAAAAKLEREEEEARRAKLAMAKGDSLAAMEAFAALAAKREKSRWDREGSEPRGDGDDNEPQRPPEPLLNATAFERRRVTAVFKDDGARGHHMGDYIPKEELAKFLAKTGDMAAAEQAKALENKNAIGADNIGHKLLSKMGWKEGEGLGHTQKGITAPIKASGAAAAETRGLGAAAHGEVSESDDPFEAYRKRMMLGYKFRPNPLGNPRKSYY